MTTQGHPAAGISIVIATVCRPSLLRAVRSIFAQSYAGPLQILIGVDKDLTGQADEIRQVLEAERPPDCSLLWIDPGYSTSVRHGGPHLCAFGGGLRSALTFLARHRWVMYLDDDDWLAPDHCQSIAEAMPGKDWAFAYCHYADGETSTALCPDLLESVGPGQGLYAAKFGGFVRPSGLTLDKISLAPVMALWSMAMFPTGDGEDRLIFSQIKDAPHACTGKATVYYSLDPHDSLHQTRLDYMRTQGVNPGNIRKGHSFRAPEAPQEDRRP